MRRKKTDHQKEALESVVRRISSNMSEVRQTIEHFRQKFACPEVPIEAIDTLLETDFRELELWGIARDSISAAQMKHEISFEKSNQRTDPRT